MTGAALLVVYTLTMAPGVTFWDAGEFIAAAHGFGIPHPPGTPLYVALGRAAIVVLGGIASSARIMVALSASCTAAAGALTAWLLARETPGEPAHAWGAIAAALVAGLMCSVWDNATETEVYALALLHVATMLACASRVDDTPRGAQWLALTAYLMTLAPAVHLSALVGAPAAIVLATRGHDGRWSWSRGLMLGGVLLFAAGIGRVSAWLAILGIAVSLAGILSADSPMRRAFATLLPLMALATSALLIMLVRARHDPALNQGDPANLAALLDVVGRRQYAVAGLLPRQAPAWLQAANVAQYADWQVAMGWGRGIYTTAPRVMATLVYLALGVLGWRRLRRSSPRLALALGTLIVCGSLGVASYLNLKAGASLGWGALPDSLPHEARERDYFFVLGFWGWGCLAGWGALALARRMHRPWLAVLAAAVPLVANWGTVDRAHGLEADAARRFAAELLGGIPRDAVFFAGGDNDSYPLWYLQQVEGARPDVQLVTLPLLPAAWYPREIGHRTGLAWDASEPVPGALWTHEVTAGAIARSALAHGRPVAASPALTVRERSLLGDGWVLRGPVYVATASRSDPEGGPPAVDTAAARAWLARYPPVGSGGGDHMPDDVAPMMLELLTCPRLARPWAGSAAGRDSLETRCNFR